MIFINHVNHVNMLDASFCSRCDGIGRLLVMNRGVEDCSSCKGTGLDRGDTVPLNRSVQAVGLCEICGVRSFGPICTATPEFHTEAQSVTEKAKRGGVPLPVLALRTAFGGECDRFGLGQKGWQWVDANTAEDINEHMKQGRGLFLLDWMIRAAEVVRGTGMPWWMATLETDQESAWKKQLGRVCGYSWAQQTDAKHHVYFAPDAMNLQQINWLRNAWALGLPTRYKPEDLKELLALPVRRDDLRLLRQV